MGRVPYKMAMKELIATLTIAIVLVNILPSHVGDVAKTAANLRAAAPYRASPHNMSFLVGYVRSVRCYKSQLILCIFLIISFFFLRYLLFFPPSPFTILLF